FTAPGARLRITTDPWDAADGHAAWWLHVDSAAALTDLARRVWHIDTLADTLQSSTKAGRAVLKRLRAAGGAGRGGRAAGGPPPPFFPPPPPQESKTFPGPPLPRRFRP